MAIDCIYVLNTDRGIIGIIDTARSIIWHSIYFGVGDFEVYVSATSQNIEVLKKDFYIIRPDSEEVGIIEHVENSQNQQDGKMLIVSGRFAKSILDRRLIYKLSGTSNKATVLRGNVESAARALVANNLISCDFDNSRNIPFFELGANAGITKIIVDDNGQPASKQVSYQGLLEYTDSLLEEYGMAAKVILNDDTKKLQYVVYQGADRSINNAAGNEPVIFSTDYDNLIESNYTADTTNLKNTALIGGEGEGVQRFYTLIRGSESGINRREMWVDASSISKTYKDEQEQDRTYTDAEYTEMLKTQGKQQLSEMKFEEYFDGKINVSFGNWQLNRDFYLGDIVTVQNNDIGIYADVRITEITEIQDENGYTVEANYQ